AADPPPPVITNLIVNGSQKSLRLDGLYPGASNYTFLSSTTLASPLTPNTNFFLAPYVLNVFTNNGTNYGTNWAYEWRLTNNTAANIPLIGAKFAEATNFVVGSWSHYSTNITYTTNGTVVTTNYITVTNAVYGTNATISDLRAWHILRAVSARRQLLEILLQFLENHFVTQYSKSVTWFDNYYDNGTVMNVLAAQLEYLENEKWRNALLNHACTFY